MQAEREREVAEVVGRELHLLAAVRERQLLDRHHAGVVDEDVERPVPAGHEGVDAGEVGQLEVGDRDVVVAGARADVAGDLLAVAGPAHGEGDRGPSSGERAGGLDADARGAAGDDRPLAREVDALDHLRCRRLVAERGRDPLRWS